MARASITALAAMTTVGLLAACSSGAGSDPAASSSTPAPGATGTAAAGGGPCDGKVDGPVTITLPTHVKNDPSLPVNPITVYKGLVDEFNSTVGKEKGITVEVQPAGETAYEQAVTSAVQSGKQIDIVESDAPTVGRFIYDGVIQPLGNCATADKLATMLPAVVEAGKYEGQQYMLGAYTGGMGLWASKKALTKVGATLPTSPQEAWTVEQFDKVLKDLKAAGYATPLNIEWGYGAGEWRAFGFGPTLLSAGGGLLKPDFSGAEGALNSPESVKALTWFQQWSKAGLIDLATAGGANDANFTSGKTAISWVGHWMGGAYKKALGDDLVLLPLPNFGKGSRVYGGSWAFGISKTTKDPDAAWALIDFMTSKGAKRLTDSESAIPGVKADFDADPAYQQGGDRYLYAQVLQGDGLAVPRPTTPAYLTARDEFSTAFADIIGGAGVKATLDKAAKKIDDDIAANDGYKLK